MEMGVEPGSVMERLSQVHDPRQGKRYRLTGLVGMLLLVALHRESSLRGMWLWAEGQWERIAGPLDLWGNARPPAYGTLEARAWTALEKSLDSPYASPLLLHEDVYFEVAQECRTRRDPRALSIMERSLAHVMHFNDGINAESFLCDIAETHLWLGEFNETPP